MKFYGLIVPLLLLFLVLCTCDSPWEDPADTSINGFVEGEVFGLEGLPLEGVLVSVSRQKYTFTNANGRYYLSGVYGPQNITFNKQDYRSFTKYGYDNSQFYLTLTYTGDEEEEEMGSLEGVITISDPIPTTGHVWEIFLSSGSWEGFAIPENETQMTFQFNNIPQGLYSVYVRHKDENSTIINFGIARGIYIEKDNTSRVAIELEEVSTLPITCNTDNPPAGFDHYVWATANINEGFVYVSDTIPVDHTMFEMEVIDHLYWDKYHFTARADSSSLHSHQIIWDNPVIKDYEQQMQAVLPDYIQVLPKLTISNVENRPHFNWIDTQEISTMFVYIEEKIGENEYKPIWSCETQNYDITFPAIPDLAEDGLPLVLDKDYIFHYTAYQIPNYDINRNPSWDNLTGAFWIDDNELVW